MAVVSCPLKGVKVDAQKTVNARDPIIMPPKILPRGLFLTVKYNHLLQKGHVKA
jgi:hypothetical protein